MTKTITPVSFFFGANNKSSYVSLFSSMYDPKSDGKHYILKGGPGTGKSTLMKKLASELERKGYFVERGYCSADPNSLDVVLAPEINFSIVDGTAPHEFNATYPGVTEFIVNLGEAWDKKYLNEYKTAIINLGDENKKMHKKAAEYMQVASRLQLENIKYCDKITNKDKLKNYAERLCKREIPIRKNEEKGEVKKRFLSAVSPEGIVVQYDTIVALSEKIITIKDDYSMSAPFIMDYISEFAVENGYTVYECYCPLFPRVKKEHIIIPELKLCFFTENSAHKSLVTEERFVHSTRFLNDEGLFKVSEKLKFNKKLESEMLEEAVKKISVAKGIHDRLEDYYIRATDFSVIDEICEKLFKEVF